mmetsp:Transcript_20219/g.44136  ORF Transcript_20219/g.44136 Transcript_20219/m.44136 type:complete len:262 (+) Transcript_20219:424-1209(+)
MVDTLLLENAEQLLGWCLVQAFQVHGFEDLRRGEPDPWLHQENRHVRRHRQGSNWRNDLTTASAIGCPFGQEEGSVGTDHWIFCPFNQVLVRCRSSTQRIGTEESCGRIAAATSHASLGRSALLQVQTEACSLATHLSEQVEGSNHEVGLVGWDSRQIACELVLRCLGWKHFHIQGVSEGDCVKEGCEIVIAIRSSSDDAQKQVHLGRRKEAHLVASLGCSRCHLRPRLPLGARVCGSPACSHSCEDRASQPSPTLAWSVL